MPGHLRAGEQVAERPVGSGSRAYQGGKLQVFAALLEAHRKEAGAPEPDLDLAQVSMRGPRVIMSLVGAT